MRSALHLTFGEPSEVLTLGDSPVPKVGPGEVRIRMRLSPIHNHDLSTIRGQYGYKPTLPAIGGSEAVGSIDALGEGVTGLAIGQRVAVAGVHGTWAEFFIAPAMLLIPMPDVLSDETAAQLIAMPLSALMLLEFLDVKAGHWIVQNTANGAVGKALAMLAAARGVHTVNLVRRDAGVGELSEFGITHVVSTASEGWQKKVHAITAGTPISAAVDSVGGRASGELLALLGEGGTLVSFGAMSAEPMQISPGDLIFKQATVKGFWGSKVSQGTSVENKQRLIGELFKRAISGELQLPVEATYGLADAAKAAAASLQPGRKGKILLRP